MKKLRLIIYFGLIISIYSCSARKEEMKESALMDSIKSKSSPAESFASSSAAVENKNDTARRFIRTADLKFKVKNVIISTYNIEDIIRHHRGFVTYTNLSSNIDNVITTPVSADSSLETTHYTVSNTMILRVPNTLLDSTLKEISKNIDFLDYRIIKADDVALQILSNNLSQKRAGKSISQVSNATDNKGKKQNDAVRAADFISNVQEIADEAKISNLYLVDQINFSTINLFIYQRPSIKRIVIANDKNIDAYEPGFGRSIIEALLFGWSMLESFIVFLVKLWGLVILVILTVVIYKLIRRRYTKKQANKS